MKFPPYPDEHVAEAVAELRGPNAPACSCCSDPMSLMTGDQAAAIVEAWYAAHPERRPPQ